MPDKKKFALRLNIEDSKALEKWAADEFRSLNGQIEYLLHQAVPKAQPFYLYFYYCFIHNLQ